MEAILLIWTPDKDKIKILVTHFTKKDLTYFAAG